MFKQWVFSLCCLLMACTNSWSQQQVISFQEKTDPKIMDAFMDMRFGVFIHWGPVTLRGTEIGWSRNHQVTQADYDSLYLEFNPVLFDADSWVKTVKDAGAKYLTITAKHHDGFCLWPSKYSEYNISKTPYKKDIVGQLAKACKRHGIKFCIYYTVLDWYHPDYPLHNDGNKTLDPNADMGRFVTYMKNQLTELITQYKPYMLWFDGNWEQPWTREMGADVYAHIKKLDPTVIVNNRLGKGTHKVMSAESVGDYATPEQEIGKINMKDPWESCITICKQWSWKPNDEMKSLSQCLKTLSATAGGNGNLLLNISPMPDGRIEQRQVVRLNQIGQWLQKNGTAIYGTKGGPYVPDSMYVSTRKDNKIFIHLLSPHLRQLELKAIPGIQLKKASFISGEPLQFEQKSDRIYLHWQSISPSGGGYVIELEMDQHVDDLELISPTKQ